MAMVLWFVLFVNLNGFLGFWLNEIVVVGFWCVVEVVMGNGVAFERL